MVVQIRRKIPHSIRIPLLDELCQDAIWPLNPMVLFIWHVNDIPKVCIERDRRSATAEEEGFLLSGSLEDNLPRLLACAAESNGAGRESRTKPLWDVTVVAVFVRHRTDSDYTRLLVIKCVNPDLET